MCDYPIMLSVCLNFQHQECFSDKFIMRFFSEKVFGIELQMSCFTQNSKGFPVLSKQLAKLCQEFMKVQARMIIAPKMPNENLERHYNYMTYLFAQHDKLNEEDLIEHEYRNYLQSPLQPLADNLESTTYETFEKDSIKYELYERACCAAMQDKMKYGKFL